MPTLIDPRIERLKRFVKEYREESDRAAVILVGARLEYLLGELLRAYLLPTVGSDDELLDTDRALGTFSARIHAACRLALIDADFARSLHIFRRLRNSFAHETSGNSFDHGAYRDRIHELAAPFVKYAEYCNFRDWFLKDKPNMPAIAADFYTAAAILIARIETAYLKVEKISETQVWPLVSPAWKKNTKEEN